MTPWVMLALLCSSLFFALAAVGYAPRFRELAWWFGSWPLLIGSGLLVTLNPPGSGLFAAAAAVHPAFFGLQLAGAFAFAGRRVPPWLWPATAAAGALRGGLAWAGSLSFNHAAVLPFELLALGYGGSLVLRTRPAAFAPRMILSGGMLALAALEGWDIGLDFLDPANPVPWSAWLLLGTPISVLQVAAALERLRARERESESSRLRAEAALGESERRFLAVAEHSHDLIAEADEEGRLLYASPSIERTFGYPAADLRLGAGHLLHPEDRARLQQTKPGLPERGGLLPPIRIRRKDGRYLWVEIALRAYTALEGGRRLSIVARDVTERLEAEEREARARRLESLGVLAGGIAHDFNNLLTGVLGNAELALAELEAGHPARELVQEISAAGERAAALTQQLLLYSRQARGARRRLDAAELLRSEEPLLRQAVPAPLRFELSLAEPLPPIEAEPNQLRQVLHNLVTNAAEACRELGRVVRLEAGPADGFEPVAGRLAVGELGPGEYLCIAVSDDGPGFDGEKAQHLFDPFYSTRFPGRGLGLAVVHSVIRAHDGALAVHAAPGHGARFSIYLPAAP